MMKVLTESGHKVINVDNINIKKANTDRYGRATETSMEYGFVSTRVARKNTINDNSQQTLKAANQDKIKFHQNKSNPINKSKSDDIKQLSDCVFPKMKKPVSFLKSGKNSLELTTKKFVPCKL